MPEVSLIDSTTSFGENCDGLFIEQSQELPDDFTAWCDEMRTAQAARSGAYHQVCSVPTVVVEMWRKDGFDVMHAPAREIVARLRRENLDVFITTPKAV